MSEESTVSFYKLLQPSTEAVLELIQLQVEEDEDIVEHYHSQKGYSYLSDQEIHELPPGYKVLDNLTYKKLTEDLAWEKLCKGLAKGNAKTLEWLGQRGVVIG